MLLEIGILFEPDPDPESNPGSDKLSDVAGSAAEDAVSINCADGVDIVRKGKPGSLKSDPEGLLGFK